MSSKTQRDSDGKTPSVHILEREKPSQPGGLFSSRYWTQVLRWSLVSLLLFELFIRIFVLMPPPAEYKPEWGIVPIENTDSLQGWEGYAVTHFDADGEVETPYRDPDGVSIVILGDSTVQAAQVDNDKNFTSLTETALREKGLRVDLHNLGRPLQSVADHVYIAPAVNAVFSPQIVVVQVNPSNFDLSYRASQDNQFIEGDNGDLVLVHREPAELKKLALHNFLNRSALYAYLDFRLILVFRNTTAPGARIISSFAEAAPSDEQNGRPSAARIPASERYISQVNLLRKAYPTSKIIFLVIPYVPTVSWQDGLRLSWRSEGDDDLTRVLAQIDGVYVLSASDAFRDLYRKYSVFPRGAFNTAFNYGHLNESGHVAVAQVLTEALEQILR